MSVVHCTSSHFPSPTGMAAFLPKYFESQFSLSPGNAATLVGTLVVPAGAGGTLIGG